MNDADTVYEAIGGEAGVRKLVDDFYDEMDTNPAVRVIRDMHAKDSKSSRQKLFMFLSGWMGGPSLYIEKYGHPRLRMRHFPFEIDNAAAEQWMVCMNIALDKADLHPELRRRLSDAFAGVAAHMRNRPG